MAAAKHVELLYFAGCPNHRAARTLVERIAAEDNVPIELELVEVHSAEEAEQRRFLGSPSVRVNGQDVEPGSQERTEFTLACRLYRTDSGLSGQPAKDWVRNALHT